jgi:general secretion pathway protein M
VKFGLKADRPTFVVGATLAVLLIALLYGVLTFGLMWQSYDDAIDNILPRTARLLGIIESREALGLAADEAVLLLSEVVYTAESDSAGTAAAMQQNVRELMAAAGLSISGSQILPTGDGGDYERLRLDITVEGNIDSLDEALAQLEIMLPVVFIESFRVKHARGGGSRLPTRGMSREIFSGDPRRLTARLQLVSLRSKS